MAPSTSIFALFLAFALVAGAVQPSEAIRVVQAASSTADPEAPRKPATAPAAGQMPGFPFPFFPLPGGAPPAGQVPGFPFPLFPLPGFPFPLFPPLFPLPGDAPTAGQAPGGFPFPLFPPLFPLPGAPPAAGQFPGFPLPLFPLPSIPGFPPVNPRPASPGSPQPPAQSSPTTSATMPPPPPPTSAAAGTSSSTAPPPQVTDCLPPLMGLTPCMDYLTNTGVGAPPSTCCDSFKSLVNDAPICLCHGLNGDINKIMPAPMDFTRMMSLPATCGVALPLQTLAKCSTEPVPPLRPALAPASAPSPDSSP